MKKILALFLLTLFIGSLLAMPVSAKGGEFFGGLTWDLQDNILTISGKGAMPDWSAASKTPWYSSKGTINAIKIEEGITHIGKYAFYGFSNVARIKIPSTVSSIGDYAFSECKNLENLLFYPYVKEIGKNAFDKCDNLAGIYYAGSYENWTWTTSYFQTGNDALKNAKIYLHHNIEDAFSVPIQVVVNSKILKADQPPVLLEGRTLIPLRLILEALGATVGWDPKEQKVTTEREGIKVEFVIGSTEILVNGQKGTIDVPAQLIGGRTLVPVRAVSEAFQLKVLWNPHTHTVTVN